MASELELIEAEALKLTGVQRAHLVEHLIASLATDAEIDEAWAVEIERRVADIEAGQVTLTPAAEAIADARSALT